MIRDGFMTRKGPDRSLRLRNSLNRLFKACLVFSMLILPLAGLSMADEPAESKTIEATGTATISPDNAAAARDAAIGDALRKAVEQAVGTLVSSETMVENYQVLSDNVYTRTQGYIRSYAVIKEAQAQGLYQVTVRAIVGVGPLEDDLGAMGLLQRKVQRPRVLFMISEKNIGHRYYSFWWWGRSEYRGETVDISSAETSLKELFGKKGFNVVDIMAARSGVATGSISAPFEVQDAFKVEDLTQTAVRQIGREINADVVVYGKALATEGPRTPGSAVSSYIADMTAQAVNVDDGVVLGASKGHGISRNVSGVTGGTEAISRAATEAGERLIEQITAKWVGPSYITMRITNITDYRKITDFTKALKVRVRGISAIYQRKFVPGEAVFEIESKSSAQAIADQVSRLGLPFKVMETTQNTIEIIMQTPQ
ncbi:MAG: flagellar assembly protein T N-terminal domain-containing protein [Deltaproteobacteria bacterium]|nr:flagellar assembly protein T N-terminal domain-containing protein [Deltaproteobacteria bacterium]